MSARLLDDRLKELNHALTDAIAPPLTAREALELLEAFAEEVDASMEGLKSDISNEEKSP
mgnify:CR=1 FL=1